MALPAKADADTWHRRMGHIDGKRLEHLNETEHGASFNWRVSPCDICTLGKNPASEPQDCNTQHQTTLRINTYTNFFGPTVGGLQYVSKVIDERQTNPYDVSPWGWWYREEIAFSDAARPEVASTSDKSSGATAFEQPSTCGLRQLTDVSKRQGRIFAVIIRCLVVDNELSKFLWGGLMWAVTCLTNRRLT